MTYPFWKGLISLFLLPAVCLIVFFPLRAQDPPRPYPIDIIPASPTAQSLHQYGDVPVTLFNGLPNISIPLMEVGDRDLRLPITLSYHASGINPEQHPGWVGLGWSLQAGGVITRSQRGTTDEVVSDFGPDSLRYSYYTNFDVIDTAEWFSLESLQRFDTVDTGLAQPTPDEFRFTFMGYSGSFYLNHLGEWQVKSDQNIAIQVEVDEPAPISVFTIGKRVKAESQVARALQRFILTTENGTRYTFGGDTSNIEFTQRLGDDDPVYFSGVVATSWYLTRIETVDGRIITLEYEAGPWQAEQTVLFQLYERIINDNFNLAGSVSRQQNPYVNSASLINPVYLKKISTPNAEVHFSRSETTELGYDFGQFLQNPLQFLPLQIIDEGGSPSWYQLDSIRLVAKGEDECRQYVGFTYSEDENKRLTLLGLRVMGTQAAQGPYTFTYNTTSLPDYNTLEQDHWGYYNGRNFIDDNPLGGGQLFYTRDDSTAYYTSRIPDTTLMKAEILTEIRYPTGGSTRFVYEPHDYSQIATKYPFGIEAVSGNPIAGGLRIDSIISVPGYGAPEVIKTYHYVNDFLNGGTESSGILSDSARYVTEYTTISKGDTLDIYELSSVPVESFLTTDGNHVTYSEVTEKLSDGSFTIYRYTNHENSIYQDKGAEANIAPLDNRFWRYDPFTSRELERGNLLSKTMYRADSSVVMEEEYTYNSDPDRFNEFVRFVEVKNRSFYIGGENQFVDQVFETRITAYVEYTYTPYMTSKTERLYDPEDDSQFVETVYTYQYDNPVHNQLTRTQMTDSEDSIRVTRYTYPPDLTSNLYNRDTLIARHVFTPAVVQVDSVGSRQSFQVERYMNRASGNTELIVLDSTITYPSGEGIDPIRMFYQYDTIGNIVQVQKEDDLPAAFIWGYNGEFPIAEVLNATSDQILYTGFEEATSSVSLDAFSGNQAHVGNYLVELPSPGTYQLTYWQDTGSGWALQSDTISANTTINSGTNRIDDVRLYPVGALMRNLTYDRLYGQTSLSDACGIVRRFRYDGLGRLKLVRDHQDRIEQSYFYRYANQD